MEIFIRPALVDEATNLTRIAFAAKRHWQYPEAWIELWSDELTLSGEYIQSHDVFCASIANVMAGWYALRLSEAAWELDYFWVLPEAMGRGVGAAMMGHVKSRLLESRAETLTVISDPHAEWFYLKMGFEKTGMQPSRPEGRFLPVLRFTGKS